MSLVQTVSLSEATSSRGWRLRFGHPGAVLRPTFVMLAFSLLISARDMRAQGQGQPLIDTLQYAVLRVQPSQTNAAIHSWDTTHVVYYDPTRRPNKILLWLAGTNGTPLNIPTALFATALAQGYRIIALSYITSPAVSQTCVGDVLDSNIMCPEMFRRKRIYGDNVFPLIGDAPQDAIIPRFVSLLQWLSKNDARGNWSHYLSDDGSKPRWSNIAVSGQSQGGGMAEFIAQHEIVARVLSFSGGWDWANSREKKIATWYANRSVTPMDRWFATFNVNELAATQLREICSVLQIPAGHIFALDQPLMNTSRSTPGPNPFHGDGIRNTAYQPVWLKMLGSGVD